MWDGNYYSRNRDLTPSRHSFSLCATDTASRSSSLVCDNRRKHDILEEAQSVSPTRGQREIEKAKRFPVG